MRIISFLCIHLLLLVGCQTVKSTINSWIFEEDKKLSNGELVGIWHKCQSCGAFCRIVWEEDSKSGKNAPKPVPKPAEKAKKNIASEIQQRILQIKYIIQKKKEEEEWLEKCQELQKALCVRHPLFLQRGHEKCCTAFDTIPKKPYKFPWFLIVEPYLTTGTVQTDQPLFDYLMNLMLHNIENIQGRAGIGVEW